MKYGRHLMAGTIAIAFWIGGLAPKMLFAAGTVVTSHPAYYQYQKTVLLRNATESSAHGVQVNVVLLPPPSAYAAFRIVRMSRTPIALHRDAFGNLIGTFRWPVLPPHRTARLVIVEDVRAEAVSFRLPSRFPAYPHTAVYRRYTSPALEAPIVNTGSPTLQALDRSLTRPGENPLVRATAYYAWIANHILYSYSDTPAGSALMALKTRSGVCTDFADLFVGMLRTDHIPAQLVTGYVMNNGAGQTGFHEWVRFMLPGVGFVVADPTWAAAGDIAALHDDWHIPLYVGLRPDVSVTWENYGLRAAAITIRTRYRFSALAAHALPTAMRLPGAGPPRSLDPVLAAPYGPLPERGS